jgi:PAS domain S-box-containing protein
MPSSTVLVVEDNPTTRKMLCLALSTEGYAVVEAADARTAIEAAGRNLPDLVLQDLILPDMDGLELLRRLRSLPGGTEIPILALSGFLSRLAETEKDQDGFTAVLVKPIEPSRLVEAIQLYLHRAADPPEPRGEGRRLLIVDDDPVQLKLSRLHFSQLGFEVATAPGAAEALAAARLHPPDVVVSDVYMPELDGFELCLELRRDPLLAKIPMVLVSAHYGSKADEDLARRVGASALVLRTPDFDQLTPAIDTALRSATPAEAEPPSDQLALRHARLVIHQLERQVAASAGLAQRCAIQAGQIALLSGVADALRTRADPDLAVRDVLAATLDAAGISKGALLLKDGNGRMRLRQEIGFSPAERELLESFFGESALLAQIVERGQSLILPSTAVAEATSRAILVGADIAGAQIVPLVSDGRGVGAMLIGATSSDVTSEDSVSFARAMGNQVVQLLELSKTVARLTASEQRYRTLVESANDFIAVVTPEGIVREMNRRWAELTGRPVEEMIGLHVRDFAPEGKGDETFRTFREAVSARPTHSPSVEIAGANATSARIEFSSATVEVGGESLVLAIGRDVTESLRASEALKIAEERMRFALESADVGIWDLDYETGALRWSRTLESHYGLEPDTFGGTFEAFLDCVHPDDRQQLLETIRDAEKSGTDFSLHNRTTWRDGTVRWLDGTGRVLLGVDGRPSRAVGISIDVTERRSLEAQFQQAQKMEAIGRLAGGVAHDFNNLLTVILGFCELLISDRGPTDPHRADIAEIQKAGQRGAELTRQLLAFSRKQIIEPTLLDLNEVVAGMQALLGRLIGEDVKVVFLLRPGLAPVRADRGQVEQVVMNLAVNARDAMPKGGTLTIESANVVLDENYAKAHLDVESGAYVVLTVTDSGTGMPLEVQARLFEPFFTTKEPGKGTGLGLATVYGIVRRSGGTIGVYSEVGKGSAFNVYFPRASDPARVAEAAIPPVRTRSETETILLVEDESSLRTLTKRMLERQGYTVFVASRAEEALRVFDQNSGIDLLLTDVVMPGASGPELAGQLVQKLPSLRVLYMSGYTEDVIVQQGVLLPGISFLNKPFTSRSLNEKIRELLDG